MNKQKIYSICGIALFVVAGLLLVYTGWSLTHCVDIIAEAKAGGQLTASGNEYDIISFYMGNCAQYFIYALLIAVAGLLLQKSEVTQMKEATADTVSVKSTSESDVELDEWFEEFEADKSTKNQVT